MRVLVVYCHPVADSFCAALHRTAVAALTRTGHQVIDLDLYAEGFDPVLSTAERIAYNDPNQPTDHIADHVAHLEAADGLVLIFPTWWYGLPAMLKGWFDRVWLPGTAFDLPVGDAPIQPRLTNIKKIGVVTTYGSPWWWIKFIGDPGRRVLLRGIRPLCHKRCKTFWMAHYKMDSATAPSLRKFLADVDRKMAAF